MKQSLKLRLGSAADWRNTLAAKSADVRHTSDESSFRLVHALRAWLARIDLLHAGWYLLNALAEIVQSRTGATRARLDRRYRDPRAQWAFGDAAGQEHYLRS